MDFETDERETHQIAADARHLAAHPERETQQIRRLRALLAVLDYYDVPFQRGHVDDVQGDAPLAMLAGHEPVGRWVVVTESGSSENNYAYCGTLDYAKRRGEEYVTDDISRETPLALYDLDGEPGTHGLPPVKFPEISVRWT